MTPCHRTIVVTIALACAVDGLPLASAETVAPPNATAPTRTVRHIDSGGAHFDLTMVDADPAEFSLKVLAAGSLVAKQSQLQRGTYTTSGIPLTDFRQLSSAAAVISGGYLSSYAPVEALGYVQVDRAVENRKHKSWLVDGLLCIQGGSPQIVPAEEQSWEALPGKFDDCLQAGPRLVVDGHVTFPRPEETQAGAAKLASAESAQTFVCIDDRRHFILGLTSEVTIGPVSSLLAQPRASGGLGCQQAIRLSGRGGLIAGAEQTGVIDDLLPNAIAIVGRTSPKSRAGGAGSSRRPSSR